MMGRTRMEEKGKRWKNGLQSFFKTNWKRLLLWLAAAAVCGYFCFITEHLSRFNLPWRTTRVFPYMDVYNPRRNLPQMAELEPGQSLTYTFTAMGSTVGVCGELYLEIPKQDDETLTASVCIREQRSGEILAVVDGGSVVSLDGTTQYEEKEPMEEEDVFAVFPFREEIELRSGVRYEIEVANTAQETNLMVCLDAGENGACTRSDGMEMEGVLNFGLLRTSCYTASRLLKLMMCVTAVTMLGGLALVLFTQVKEHVLYLALAAGFGIVMLFDLTPLYGFDMRFQFDSAYVTSNELLGMEGVVYAPSRRNPEQQVLHYYRRVCDDYTLFQFDRADGVSDNYTDMAATFRGKRATPEGQELELVETYQGIIGGQRYILYLPQAIGFTVARLLGMNFLLMVQLGRTANYFVFVLLIFFSIRIIPFGKRLLLILALMPSAMIQTVSITRDCMIIGLSFFIVAKVLQMAYCEHIPSAWDWVKILLASVLLAPCKSVYLPICFFWILVICKQYVRKGNGRNVKTALFTAAGAVAIIAAFILLSHNSVRSLLLSVLGRESSQSTNGDVLPDGVQAFTVSYIVTHLPTMFMIVMNTLREQLGSLILNTVQLYDIGLGSDDLVTIILLGLLMLECCSNSEKAPGAAERWTCLGISVLVAALIAAAALQWTSLGNVVGTFSIVGIQGRYLIPIMPLLGICVMNNRIVRFNGKNAAAIVKAGCCIVPAIYLMNMYLWTIQR